MFLRPWSALLSSPHRFPGSTSHRMQLFNKAMLCVSSSGVRPVTSSTKAQAEASLSRTK